MRLLISVICLFLMCGHASAQEKRLYNTDHWPSDAVEMWEHLRKALGYTYDVECSNVSPVEAVQGCEEEKDEIQKEIREFIGRIEGAAEAFADGNLDAYEALWPDVEKDYPEMFSSAKGFRKAYPNE
jgi:hypothetical protein